VKGKSQLMIMMGKINAIVSANTEGELEEQILQNYSKPINN
jgi:hypothetical protein